MIAAVLFIVFFLQFLSIMTSPDIGQPPGIAQETGADRLRDDGGPMTAGRAEIARRLVNFMILSIVVGLGAGIVIARIVSAPINDLAKAAHRVGQGELGVRVRPHGSREMVELANTFNRMAADLQHAEVLRNNLMADVSHELRTPLTVLEGNLRAALDHVYALDEAEIANLYGQTRHLIRLVSDLRELALAENHQLPLERQPTDLNALVAETLQAIDPLAAEKGVRLASRTMPLPELTVDPLRIRQVLFNLLSNALRHTPTGGEISVSSAREGSEVRLAVRDTGEGLEPDQLAAVFDRFYRTDRSRSRDTGGTGLGLAIVKAIVEAHGGRVAAHSDGRKRGSTFTVVLPVG
jgi:signal transduction histidine kinase